MQRRGFLFAGAGALSCARDKRPRLNVYNWSAYIDPAMLARFEAERGIRIRYGTYESNEEMLAKIASGNSGWDVVFPTHSRLAPMAAHGLIAPLDHRRLPGLQNLDVRFQRPVWDPTIQWGVPYMWNATGIAYNKAEVPQPHGWEALWSPALRGRMTMLDDPEDVIGACLEKLHFPFSSGDEAQLTAAAAEAIRQKPLLRGYINAEVRDQLTAGDVLACQLWSTTAAQAIRANRNLGFAFPEEGYPLYCDCAVVLRESTRYELAHEFLDFLLRPDVALANSRVADTATAVKVDDSHDVVLYPPGSIYRTGVWVAALPVQAQKIRDILWTRIKAV
ncbi:MAG: spermidine/putrescine ABC transporter substrate-binding protein [Terriglobia bacterium]